MQAKSKLALILSAALMVALIFGYHFYHNQKPQFDKSYRLVERVYHHQQVIIRAFESRTGLLGFIVQPDNPPNAKAQLIYTNRQGNLILTGTVFDSTGENVSLADFAHYIQMPFALKAYTTIANTDYIEQGDAQAPHKLYAVIDPNCIYCHDLYEALQPFIQQHQLAVRWIVIGIIKPSSLAKAAAILTAANPKQALALNESHFRRHQEEGGINPIANMTKAEMQKAVQHNMAFIRRNAIRVTPTLFFKTTQGYRQSRRGLMPKAQLSRLIKNYGQSILSLNPGYRSEWRLHPIR